MTKLYRTPAEAKAEVLRPVARIIGDGTKAKCRGAECGAWRWKPQKWLDPEFASAIKREMMALAKEQNEIEGKNRPHTAFHKQAVERVARNPEGYGIERTEGFCGLGGAIT